MLSTSVDIGNGNRNAEQVQKKRKQINISQEMPDEIINNIIDYAKPQLFDGVLDRATRIVTNKRVLYIDFYAGKYRVWGCCTFHNIANYTKIDRLLSSAGDTGISWPNIETILTFQKSAMDETQLHDWKPELVVEHTNFDIIRKTLLEKYEICEKISYQTIHFVHKLQNHNKQNIPIKCKNDIQDKNTIIIQVYQIISKSYCTIIADIKDEGAYNEVFITIGTCYKGDILPSLPEDTTIVIREFPLRTFHIDDENEQELCILTNFRAFLEFTARQVYDWLSNHGTLCRIPLSEAEDAYSLVAYNAKEYMDTFLRTESK